MKMMPLLNFKMKSAIINHNVDFCESSWILQCFLFFFGLKVLFWQKCYVSVWFPVRIAEKWQIFSNFRNY